ncbi:protein pitchfork-like isoform X1 [Hydractinia symbiolongicarpus]|uniref:protein pitchfork-like isoform X1 n=1 Tax=Hydractinia symbiolongicarpus TaxID=13093 RepID=UPI00254E1A7A|nr:protein pitchfork-like isoform X1 [Hydractinia symbiolongicarpus]
MSLDITEHMKVFLLSNKKESKVAFGTTLNRELLPLKTPHTRAGNELGLRGIPNLAPGSYNNAEVSSFVHVLNQKPMCKKGYALGARTAPRFQRGFDAEVPGPPAYQRIISKPKEFSQAVKPFQCGLTRFPKLKHETMPGPGTYEHGVGRNRKVQFHGSFGGPQTLRASIKTICIDDEIKTCFACSIPPVGDFYINNKKNTLCRLCYKDLEQSEKDQRLLSKFIKVRDCADIHSHQETNAKLRLKSDKDIKKLKQREAYLSLYYE